jgi:Rft protein
VEDELLVACIHSFMEPQPVVVSIPLSPPELSSAATTASAPDTASNRLTVTVARMPMSVSAVPHTPSTPSPSIAAASHAQASSYQAGSGLAQVSFLALNQLFTRGVTFVMNLYVARSVGPVAFGLQAIHLYLLNTCILFLSREATRKATIRYASKAPPAAFSASFTRSRYETLMVVNLSWLSVALAAVLTPVLTVWFYVTAPAEAIPLGYLPCLVMYGAATLFEMLCEPLFVIAARRLLVGCRVWIDSAATLLRCLVTVAAIAAFDSGLLAFAYGQIAFSVFYTSAFYAYFLFHIHHGDHHVTGVKNIAQIFPRPIPANVQTAAAREGSGVSQPLSDWLDVDLLSLYSWLLIQMAEKLALTEGEKAVMVGFQFSLDQQGVYGLIQNLGQPADIAHSPHPATVSCLSCHANRCSVAVAHLSPRSCPSPLCLQVHWWLVYSSRLWRKRRQRSSASSLLPSRRRTTAGAETGSRAVS